MEPIPPSFLPLFLQSYQFQWMSTSFFCLVSSIKFVSSLDSVPQYILQSCLWDLSPFPHSHYEHPSLALHTILASILADVVHCPTSSMSGPRPDQARYCREHLGRQGWRVHQVKQASSEKASQSEVGTRSFKAQNCKLNRTLTDGAKQHSVWAAAFSGCVWPRVFSVHERHNKRTNISITLCIYLERMIWLSFVFHGQVIQNTQGYGLLEMG